MMYKYQCIILQALDLDSASNVQYRFETEPNPDFNLDPNTGVLTTKRPLDYETRISYSFFVTTVAGINDLNPSRRAQVNIDVIVSIWVL